MGPTVAVVCTLDTKAPQAGFLAEEIRRQGCEALLIDVGVFPQTALAAAVTNEEVAAAAGTTPEEILARKDRSHAVLTMTRGAGRTLRRLHREGRIHGVVAAGGGTGTHISSGAMQALPIGVPKLIVSTIAARDMGAVIGSKDITLMHAVCDLIGLNFMTRRVLSDAAAAIAGMARNHEVPAPSRPVVGITSFGPLHECAMAAHELLEAKGYEVVPFHAVGSGSMAMESLVEQGVVKAVLDLSLHEFADQLYGGYCGRIGASRLESAGRVGIPHVILPGGIDMIAFECTSIDAMPAELWDRDFLSHDFRSFVRANADEMRSLAHIVADKVNRAAVPPTLVIPRKGYSKAGAPGGPYCDPETDAVFLTELEARLNSSVRVVKLDTHINDEACARAAVEALEALVAATAA